MDFKEWLTEQEYLDAVESFTQMGDYADAMTSDTGDVALKGIVDGIKHIDSYIGMSKYAKAFPGAVYMPR